MKLSNQQLQWIQTRLTERGLSSRQVETVTTGLSQGVDSVPSEFRQVCKQVLVELGQVDKPTAETMQRLNARVGSLGYGGGHEVVISTAQSYEAPAPPPVPAPPPQVKSAPPAPQAAPAPLSAPRSVPPSVSFNPLRAVGLGIRNLLRFGPTRSSVPDFNARVFGKDTARAKEFWKVLKEGLPCRAWGYGSLFTGHSYAKGVPYDARGPGSSDADFILDAAAFGDSIPLHGSKSIAYSSKDPFPDPRLEAVRQKLCQLAGRDVSFQLMTGGYRFAYSLLTMQPLRQVR